MRISSDINSVEKVRSANKTNCKKAKTVVSKRKVWLPSRVL